jgi:predicted RNA-binding protein with RPS1 domain
MGRGYVTNPARLLKVGQKVKVKVIQIDELGRINLSLISSPPSWRR